MDAASVLSPAAAHRDEYAMMALGWRMVAVMARHQERYEAAQPIGRTVANVTH